MKRLLIIILCFCCFNLSAQEEDDLAKDYFKRGEFEKALVTYQKLYENNKGSSKYLLRIIEIYQQLEQFPEAEALIQNQIKKSKNPQYLVELGYNYQLQNNQEQADYYYNQAKLKIEENPVYGFYVARRFEERSLLDNAVYVYEKSMELRPKSNYHFQLAKIYGEQQKTEKMFNSYVSFINTNKAYINQAKRAFSDYITDDAENENNIVLRKVLLKKIQTEPNTLWNQLLSWLFIQQRQYNKAFAQEKAIYKREQESLQGIIDLGLMAKDENDVETATSIFNYLIETAFDTSIILESHRQLLEIAQDTNNQKEFDNIKAQYESLLRDYGIHADTVELQLSYAHFLAFYLNKPNDAITFLKQALNSSLPRVSQGKLKLKLGDVLVMQEKFNEALIYYSQIQTSLKNSKISQQARFRVAKTSYYKGDFKWAESQLKILKASTSQLIANDALDLKLLISDNKLDDSTHTALKLYSKADLYIFQNKKKEALTLLDQIIANHKTESIMDQALLLQAKIYEEEKDFEKAEANYLSIIANYRDDILADDALYALAELYVNVFEQPEKAKPLYEQIIFNHADSIYFVEARKKFRQLRGDDIN
ncbi:tetratricopeptide repeat protein [Pontimicrobium sp. IMCC45349]|uniref:tetratricopeptide repeat protein n=1 Tax=Pontimicrobium sp. IMCC45349 TaxID=3391574 RepID=UPI0039A03DC2